ncbi:hypothetical protein [Myroides pelagicus]|uniref:Uncharacterized protein n=1 Tax=Myroides pelagicus TaxID=270914 RepID=A0A7K1GQ75_9FLAO|nr:hypothetical protein [Myroides pelagicus]MEC4114505.1 hypothetical protein [Myroides pelagicus]MTH30543.1 hypothetical protein [Myroides pelagicus]
MKKIYLVIVFVVLFRPVIPVVEYAINYEYIATVLCVNTDKPELQCNGKCHVAKEMTKSLEKEGKVALEKLSLTFDFQIPPSFDYPLSSHSINILIHTPNKYVNNYYYLLSPFLLDPPIV